MDFIYWRFIFDRNRWSLLYYFLSPSYRSIIVLSTTTYLLHCMDFILWMFYYWDCNPWPPFSISFASFYYRGVMHEWYRIQLSTTTYLFCLAWTSFNHLGSAFIIQNRYSTHFTLPYRSAVDAFIYQPTQPYQPVTWLEQSPCRCRDNHIHLQSNPINLFVKYQHQIDLTWSLSWWRLATDSLYRLRTLLSI